MTEDFNQSLSLKAKSAHKDKNAFVSEDKLYELAIQERKHKEDRRDQINSYYVSIFAAIIAISPFLDKISGGTSEANKG